MDTSQRATKDKLGLLHWVVGEAFGICWHFKKVGMEGSTAVPNTVMVGLPSLLHGREFLKLGMF